MECKSSIAVDFLKGNHVVGPLDSDCERLPGTAGCHPETLEPMPEWQSKHEFPLIHKTLPGHHVGLKSKGTFLEAKLVSLLDALSTWRDISDSHVSHVLQSGREGSVSREIGPVLP